MSVKRAALMAGFVAVLMPGVATAQLAEVRQTIFGMD